MTLDSISTFMIDVIMLQGMQKMRARRTPHKTTAEVEWVG